MSQPDSSQKTEQPTAKRLRDAVRDGDILQSRDLAAALVMLAGAGWMVMAGPWFLADVQSLLKTGLTLGVADVAGFDPARRIAVLARAVLPTLTVLFAATLIAAVAAPALLGSAGFRSSALAFKGSRLDPLAGFGRIFSAQGIVELAKSLLKVALVGAIGWWIVADAVEASIGLAAADPRHAAASMGAQFGNAVLWLAVGLVVIGMIDVPVQYIRRRARLRMSRQEVRDEAKETEGSPETKLQAQQRRHEILGGSARRAVTEASVVLTNPTHFAVALRYRPGKDAAPVVVARGRGDTALAIRALARGADVPTLEYPQLARAIYFSARAGQPVAPDLYLAVATILAFVFNLDRAVAEGMTQPDIDVPADKRFDESGRRAA